MKRRARNIVRTLCSSLVFLAIGLAILARVAFGEPCPTGDVGGQYLALGGDIRLELDHTCETGEVRGVLHDAGRFRYEVRGEVQHGELRFSAYRRNPDGGTVVIFSNGLDIANGGRSLHGQLEQGGMGVRTSKPITLSKSAPRWPGSAAG